MAIGERKKLPVMRTDDVFRGYLEADRVRQLKYLVADVVPVLPYNITLDTKIIPSGEANIRLSLGANLSCYNDLLLITGGYYTTGSFSFAYIVDTTNNIVVDIRPFDTSEDWASVRPSALNITDNHCILPHYSLYNAEVHSYDVTTGLSTYIETINAPSSQSFSYFGISCDGGGNVYITDIGGIDALGNKGVVYRYNWNGSTYIPTELARPPIHPNLSYGTGAAVNNNTDVASERLYTFEYGTAYVLHCIDPINNVFIESVPLTIAISTTQYYTFTLSTYDDYVITGDNSGIEVFLWDGLTNTSIQVIYPPVGASTSWGISGYIYEDMIFIGDKINQVVSFYKLNTTTGVFDFDSDIISPEPLDVDYFSSAIGVNKTHIYAGAPFDDEYYADAGAIYVYNKY